MRRTIRHLQERADCVIEIAAVVTADDPVEDRIGLLSAKPDIAAMACGSVNLGDQVLIQSADAMRQIARAASENAKAINMVCFDISHVYIARRLIDDGLVTLPFYFSLILGADGGARGDVRTLLQMVDTLPRSALWSAAGVGRAARLVGPAALLMGGHVRVGFEDNVWLRRKAQANSNAQLIEWVKNVSDAMGRDVADVAEARTLLLST